mgnify:CR=1 FL=1
MNKNCYRLIFSKVRAMLVPVAEIALSHDSAGSSTRSRTRLQRKLDAESTELLAPPLTLLKLTPALLLSLACHQAFAQNLPTGGQVIGGAASITQSNPNKLQINQSTQNAAINWQSFNVGAGNSVQFAQPSSSSRVLNRVVGVSGSTQILGSLTANGQVYIVNPQGIVFGNGAMVNVGALLATTKDISPNTFMSGGSVTLSGGSNGSGLVSNDGTINGAAGFVVLAGDQVRNTGTIKAPKGQIALAAGDQATLSLSNGQLVQVTIDSSSKNNTIDSTGVLQAHGGKIVLTTNGTNALLNSAINLSGVVSAQGGKVLVDGGAAGQLTDRVRRRSVSGGRQVSAGPRERCRRRGRRRAAACCRSRGSMASLWPMAL